MKMNDLCDSIIEKIKPFFKENVLEPVFFQKRTNGSVVSHSVFPDVRVLTASGDIVFSFIIESTKWDAKRYSINIVIGDQKYLGIYNLFVKGYCVDGFNSFSLFLDAMIKQSKHLQFIKAVNILQDSSNIQYSSNLHGIIDPQTYAKIETAFDIIKVEQKPKFIFENKKFYLNPEFLFSSEVGNFSFVKKTEIDKNYINDYVSKCADLFYNHYFIYITSALSVLYDTPVEEVSNWSPELLMSYYPVLAMEVC
jgi:hypothetical protein